MALTIQTSSIIQASPKAIWKVLMDTEKYAEWNPFITSISGKMKQNEKLKIVAGGMTLPTTILVIEPNKKLEWIGKLLLPRIFDGKHSFELKDNGNGTTTFLHYEHFSGLLVPLFKKKLNRDIKAGFEAMNVALKKRVEVNLGA